ncbi:hypothetical protein [Paracoccus sulfuroxidans]|uniref:Uncharacterized protein n=1 Tax=Paracoccus sulfuroxidans TaxID=384678 RepID=A0A562NKW4_9RHOB|nr:hypothetical protein [Paracoccus sulfuroxidans]TWI32763.1 hypothetical protein IQ24_02638 [Paracoccus sulfuroxidans]
MTPTPDQKRAFIEAARADQRMFREIADAARLPFAVVLEIWAIGSAAGKLRIADDAPGSRWIEVLA